MYTGYNLESYEYFRRVFLEVLCHSFKRFAKVIFFPMKLHRKIYLHGKFITEFLFSLSHMFPWMNKFLITENMFLPRLVNRKAAGLRIVKVLIMLLIKQ